MGGRKAGRIDAVDDVKKIKELGNGIGQGAQDQQALEQKRSLKKLLGRFKGVFWKR